MTTYHEAELLLRVFLVPTPAFSARGASSGAEFFEAALPFATSQASSFATSDETTEGHRIRCAAKDFFLMKPTLHLSQL